MNERLRIWAEDYPAYLSSRTDYAKGYKDGIVRAKESVLMLLNEAELRKVADLNIYEVFKQDGVQMIKVLCFFWEGDEGWKRTEFVGLEMPLAEYQQGMIEDDDFYWTIEAQAKQYITDFESVNDAYEALKEYKIKPLSINQVNDNTLEGVYY